ncbi:hypothetical protein BLA29_003685 [Euroglyphus maynei]|uniref:Potassium channel domain-containing protein n=1 Tax=Euroglyphus maynei TaxID=6958 RepID=A0A1Y3AMV0_EURMA|nr:hypothetical protein BLA29_003685 [Euroglyphus maynei]
MRKSRDRLIQRLSNLTNESIILRFDDWTRKAEDILIDFEKGFLHAVKYKGYDGYEELSKTNSQWSFSGALLYSIIVITTIGYGNVAPRTADKHPSSSNTLQLPRRMMLSRSLSARYHNELRANKMRASKSSKIVPVRKTTVNMPPVICNQYASYSDERLDSSMTKKPSVFRSSSMADNGAIARCRQQLNAQVRFDKKQQPLPSSTIRQSASSSNLITSSHFHQPSSDMMMLMEMNRHMTAFQQRPFVPINISDPGNSDFDSDIHNDDDDEEIQEKNIPITVCLTLVISYICGGAWFFSTSEEWSFLDASYFCFITLSTIGFGDLVPGRTVLSTHEDGQMTLAICALYLLFGMALLAMSLNLVKEKVLETVRIVGERIGILVSDDDDDDDDEEGDDGNDDYEDEDD